MSVTELIREVYEETRIVNTSELAELVYSRTPSEEIEGFYRKMLAGACSTYFAQERSRVRREASLAERIASGEIQPRPRETKADKARSWWESFKLQSINTESGDVAAGELYGKDWFYAAQQLRHTAKKMAGLADKYELIAEHVGNRKTKNADGNVIKKILGE